ncbi:MAG: protein Mom [Planctomycetota bacterium]
MFKGAVIFARGASSNLLKPYGPKVTEGAELVRVALKQHDAPVSKFLSIAVKLLRKQCPGLRLLVSIADPAEGHVGGIYQASNWTYVGQSSPSKKYIDKSGKVWHERMISKRGVQKVFGQWQRVLTPNDCQIIQCPGKYRYLLSLDEGMAKRIEPLKKPYPKTLYTNADQVLEAALITVQ